MTMDVLWAITLLNGSTNITLVIIADLNMLVDSIAASFGSESNVNGFKYIDTIVSLPFSIPPMNTKVRRFFMTERYLVKPGVTKLPTFITLLFINGLY